MSGYRSADIAGSTGLRDPTFMEGRHGPTELRPGVREFVALASLAIALEASWDHLTAYRGVVCAGNPALGQCYPTSRVVQ